MSRRFCFAASFRAWYVITLEVSLPLGFLAALNCRWAITGVDEATVVAATCDGATKLLVKDDSACLLLAMVHTDLLT